jgi:hypothetical protein
MCLWWPSGCHKNGLRVPSPQLREIEPNIPELPPKKAIGNTKPQFLQERKKALNFYLQVCFHLLFTVQVLVAETHLASTELCLPVRRYRVHCRCRTVIGSV